MAGGLNMVIDLFVGGLLGVVGSLLLGAFFTRDARRGSPLIL